MDELILIKEAIIDINGHIAILNDEGGQIVQRLATLEANVGWLMTFFKYLMAGIIGQIVFQWFHYRKTGKNNK